MTRSVAKSPRVAEQCDINIHSLTGTQGCRCRVADASSDAVEYLSIEDQSLFGGVVWNSETWSESCDVILIISEWLKIMRSDGNKHREHL
ncbi:hypothetical protein TNCV_25771 [Trichonephila clavipes]|uniref:Uncharacterized protein n=1 Tax=Trichonephila clavipes TaxID=2585209 RepID=A0A8X6W1L8_TRICX|nr:hypothetical protein TNCV_25771 [Trichonephila clavipes]